MTTETHHVHKHSSFGRWAVIALSAVLAILGLVLLAGGIWLITLGGSFYYALAGLGLIVTAVLLSRASIAAIWVYFLVWLLTAVWAFWEVGTDWWAQVPRLVAPTVVLVLVLLCLPALHSGTRKQQHQ